MATTTRVRYQEQQLQPAATYWPRVRWRTDLAVARCVDHRIGQITSCACALPGPPGFARDLGRHQRFLGDADLRLRLLHAGLRRGLAGAELIAVIDRHELLCGQFLVALQLVARALQFGLAGRERGARRGDLRTVLRLRLVGLASAARALSSVACAWATRCA